MGVDELAKEYDGIRGGPSLGGLVTMEQRMRLLAGFVTGGNPFLFYGYFKTSHLGKSTMFFVFLRRNSSQLQKLINNNKVSDLISYLFSYLHSTLSLSLLSVSCCLSNILFVKVFFL